MSDLRTRMEPSPTIPENASTDNSILRRDAILNAIAFAGQQFLRSDNWNATVDVVLERLGQATGVERVYVFQDHTGPAGKPVASLRYEWVTASCKRLLPIPGLRNTPYFARSTAQWRERLQAGEILTGKIDQSAAAFRKVFRLLSVRSFVAVPVFMAGQWWGAIGFADSQLSRDWSEMELDALQVAASLLGAAFERQQIAQERAESERFWALMSGLSAAGLEAVDEDALLDATVDQLAAVIHADHCLILLWNEAAEAASPAAATLRVQQLLSSLDNPSPPHDPVLQSLLMQQRTLVYADVASLPPAYVAVLESLPVASGLALPMIAQKKVLGAVLLGFGAKHVITVVEQERAELATQQLARFLLNARLLTAETVARQQAETLQAVGQVISSTLNLREVLERVLSELQRVVPYDSASVQRQDDNSSVIIAVQGFSDPGQRVGLAFDIDDGNLPNRAVYESQRSVIVTDVLAAHSGFGAVANSSDYIHSWMGVPLVFGGQTIGMLTLDKTELGFYTERHARMAETFAAQAAIALEHARLFEVTRQLNTQISRQAEQLGQVIDTIADGIVLLDAHNGIILANSTFYDYLPSLTGQAMATTLDQICGRPIARFLEQDGGIGWHEVAAIDESNRIFAVSANKIGIGPDAGGLVISVTDVTVEREQRKTSQAQERLATIGAMAGGIAHDFNNILQGIIGFADLLSKSDDIPVSARHRLELMAREGKRGADLIRLIVEYSREVPLNARPVDLEALIKRAARHSEASVQRPVNVTVERGEPLWSITGDGVRLLETFMALIADAAETLTPAVPVAVHVANRTVVSESNPRSTRSGPGRWVAVEITGGSEWFASPEQAHALQHDLPIIGVSSGRDVVLAQVQGVVRQHRGAIRVESQPDGCRVTLALPAAGSTETADPVTESTTGRKTP